MKSQPKLPRHPIRLRPSTIAVLVSYSLAVAIPTIGSTQTVTCLGIDGDALGVAPIRRNLVTATQTDLNVVPHLSQRIQCIGREVLFHIDDIGQPLVVKSRRIYRFLQ